MADELSIFEARKLLNLPPVFGETEIRAAFHKKIFETHPDTSGNKDAGPDVARLLAARKILLSSSPHPVSRTAEDDGYAWYRRASDLLGEALELYFRERVKYSSMPPDHPALQSFRNHMEEALELFVRVLDHFPGGIWTPDAVEQIARIQTWLGR